MSIKTILKWWGIDILIGLVSYGIELLTTSSIPAIALIFGIIGILAAIAFGSIFPFVFLYALFFNKKNPTKQI